MELLGGFSTHGANNSQLFAAGFAYSLRSCKTGIRFDSDDFIPKDKKDTRLGVFFIFGAAGRIRTADLILTKDALYRLSYSSIWRPRWGSNPRPPA